MVDATATAVADPADQHPLMSKLGALSPQDLELRRRAIVAAANGNYDDLTMDMLEELAFITSTLRKRSSGPPKTASTKTPKVKPTLDSLLDF